MQKENLYNSALSLLKQLIETQSFSGEEDQTAGLINTWLQNYGVKTTITHNNVWAVNKYFSEDKPTILLNSHHDTVRPNKGYTRTPLKAEEENGKLFGLGSNDAGAPLVSLLNTFVYYYNKTDLKYNLVMAATGEEESSGPHGLNSLIKQLPEIDFAIVGEPTQMQMAIAEKGLLVLDGYAPGIAGHAAHENTDNAIYKALEDIHWIKNYHFQKISPLLGKVKMTVTQIEAGSEHNVVPAECHFVVDIRVNENYRNEEIFDFIQSNTKSNMVARSFNLNPSFISADHPVVLAGKKWGRETYGSPTLSDQSVLSCPSLKMGPGDSTRSHQADEFIYLNELKEGIDLYINILSEIL
ncbi:MAG: M20 family metallo-hydrolase [Bacteroidales bacterium]|nr:M20 family metallo-hydrolase [Bacteroidales bacterium]